MDDPRFSMGCLPRNVGAPKENRPGSHEPKEETTQGWAYAINVLVEKFTQLLRILATRTAEDVVKAAKASVEYVL